MSALNDAWSVLGDPRRRMLYDRELFVAEAASLEDPLDDPLDDPELRVPDAYVVRRLFIAVVILVLLVGVVALLIAFTQGY